MASHEPLEEKQPEKEKIEKKPVELVKENSILPIEKVKENKTPAKNKKWK